VTGRHLDNFGWGQAFLAESADGKSVVALGQADSLFVGEELGVEVGGSRKVERALKEKWAGGGLEEVAASDYFSDVRVGVIDYAC
jgi:hypothetical protein